MWVVLRLSVRRLFALLLLFCALESLAQDPVFAQYYLNQNYLNPAFAGYTNDLSVTLNTRMQYMRVPGVLATNTLSANIACDEETKLGIGAILYDHVEGEGLLHTTAFASQFSANFPFHYQSGYTRHKGLISWGMQLGAGQKYIDWSRLNFTDQYSPYFKGIQNPTNVAPQERASNIFLDAGAGVRGIFQYGEKIKPKFLSFGAAMFHINRPVQTFFNADLKLEPRYSFYVFSYFGDNIRGRQRDLRYLSVGMLMDLQQGMRSNTLSVYKDANEYFTGGVSWRRQNFLLVDRNVDAVILHILLNYKELTFGASYEWTVSTLGEEKTFGTLEFGLQYRFEGTNLCRMPNKKACPMKGFEMGHDYPNLGM